MVTNVYIDGFNFYYACFKNWSDPFCHEHLNVGGVKWVDFRALCSASLPDDSIKRIHYCTAKVRGTPGDPDKPVRQQTYLRALQSANRIVIHEGHFESRSKNGMLLTPLPCRMNPRCLASDLVEVSVREEKGSDVNLATALLRDAFLGDFEKAVVISNDSDLAGAIRVVRVDAKRHVHVLSPYPTVVRELKSAASSHGVLDKSLLAASQLPSPVVTAKGVRLLRPHGW